jgi:hypothetical protein
MSTYPVDIKSTQLVAAGSGTIFDGPCRILGVYYLSDVASGGSIEILDGTTSLCKFAVPDGTSQHEIPYYIEFPGTGLYCATSGKATLTTITDATFFFG